MFYSPQIEGVESLKSLSVFFRTYKSGILLWCIRRELTEEQENKITERNISQCNGTKMENGSTRKPAKFCEEPSSK
jgi:hypothetical protein